MSAAPVGYRPVATLDDVTRGEFITRVYQHLLVAIGVFIAFEALLINLGVAEAMWDFIASASYAWLLLLGVLYDYWTLNEQISRKNIEKAW